MMLEIHRNLSAVEPIVLVSVPSSNEGQLLDFKFLSQENGLSITWPTPLDLAGAIKTAAPFLGSPERGDKADLGIIPIADESGARLMNIAMSTAYLLESIDHRSTLNQNKARLNIGRVVLGWDQSDKEDESGLAGEMYFRESHFRPDVVLSLMAATVPTVCIAEIPEILEAATPVTALHFSDSGATGL